MYASSVKDKKLTFVVSGMLWNRSLVMKDLETNSLWSHILGECMKGELVKAQLERLPSIMTDWQSWKRDHPETTVLAMPRTSQNYRREFYKDPSKFLVGMVEQGKTRAWSFEPLQLSPLVNDSVADQKVVLFFDSEAGAAYIYSRQVAGKTLTFRRQGNDVVDEETKSHWNLFQGIATSGPLKDKRLTPLVGITSYTKTWEKFHPDSSYWKPH